MKKWTEKIIASIAERYGTTSKAVHADIKSALKAACPSDPMQKNNFTNVEDVILYAAARVALEKIGNT